MTPSRFALLEESRLQTPKALVAIRRGIYPTPSRHTRDRHFLRDLTRVLFVEVAGIEGLRGLVARFPITKTGVTVTSLVGR